MRMAELAMMKETISGIGHNGGPEPTVIERAQECINALGQFLDGVPVITEGPHLVDAKRLVNQARGAAAELEAERVGLTAPLNTKLAGINSEYKALHNTDSKKPGVLDKILNELKDRLTAYGNAEEAKRLAEAETAKLAAEQAETAAREAEAAEMQAKQDAVVGCLDTGVAVKTAKAEQAFAAFQQASRFAARAEKQTTFRIGVQGTGKALPMRTEKTLVLESYGKAIKAIGPNETIKEAILTAARAYRKQHGQLPDGVSETCERKF